MPKMTLIDHDKCILAQNLNQIVTLLGLNVSINFVRIRIWGMYYIKTASGTDALQQRDRQLSAKQRQLLFLIGTTDFEKLPLSQQQRLSTPELVQSLMDLGFITTLNTQTTPITPEPKAMPTTEKALFSNSTLTTSVPNESAPIESKTNTTAFMEQQPNQPSVEQSAIPSPSIESEPAVFDQTNTELLKLTLSDMQEMMVDTLQRHGGLLAKNLVQQIKQCATVHELKKCQMAWVTLLQETRLPAQQLHQHMKQLQLFYQHHTQLNLS